MMLDSVSHNTFLPNTITCESLTSWSDVFGIVDEQYSLFDHQTACDSSWTSMHPEYWTRHNVCISFFQDNEDTKSSEKDYNDKACLRTGGLKSQEFQGHNRTSLQSSHLWEFVRDLLLSPEENSGILEWEDRDQGIFRVIKSDALAKMWGQRKKNDRMTYEKLSRALRIVSIQISLNACTVIRMNISKVFHLNWQRKLRSFVSFANSCTDEDKSISIGTEI